MKDFSEFEEWFRENFLEEYIAISVGGIPAASSGLDGYTEAVCGCMERAFSFKLSKYHEWLSAQLEP